MWITDVFFCIHLPVMNHYFNYYIYYSCRNLLLGLSCYVLIIFIEYATMTYLKFKKIINWTSTFWLSIINYFTIAPSNWCTHNPYSNEFRKQDTLRHESSTRQKIRCLYFVIFITYPFLTNSGNKVREPKRF